MKVLSPLIATSPVFPPTASRVNHSSTREQDENVVEGRQEHNRLNCEFAGAERLNIVAVDQHEVDFRNILEF